MPLLITELAIQSDGTWALEITNSDPTPVDTSSFFYQLYSYSSTLGGFSVNFNSLGIGSIPGNTTITVGDDSIPGLDYPSTSIIFDSPRSAVAIGLNASNGPCADSIGDISGPVFSLNTSYMSDVTRPPDTNNLTSSNTGDFLQVPFASNTLGTPVCFLAGTVISQPSGGCRVEDLQIGDEIMTHAGGRCRVKWIGRQTVACRFGPAERLMPVRFAAGSLGGGLPLAPLTVTADHGMLVDGIICHAGGLVNGNTITRVPLTEMGKSYTVYHVETEAHEIILANGAPAETFIDNVSRRVFDNFAEFESLYGDVPEMEELPYPRAMSARQVPARVRAALAARVAA